MDEKLYDKSSSPLSRLRSSTFSVDTLSLSPVSPPVSPHSQHAADVAELMGGGSPFLNAFIADSVTDETISLHVAEDIDKRAILTSNINKFQARIEEHDKHIMWWRQQIDNLNQKIQITEKNKAQTERDLRESESQLRALNRRESTRINSSAMSPREFAIAVMERRDTGDSISSDSANANSTDSSPASSPRSPSTTRSQSHSEMVRSSSHGSEHQPRSSQSILEAMKSNTKAANERS